MTTIDVECTITKQLYAKDDFRIFGCQPLNNTDIQLNRYGSFTIKGDLAYLTEGQTYKLTLSPLDKQYNGETQYEVIAVPSLELDIDNISPDEDLELLKQVASGEIINAIHEAYPDYCKRILHNEPIDLTKIKGVKDYRHNAHVRKLNEKYKYYNLQKLYSQYKLSIHDCRDIYNAFESVTLNDIHKMFADNPYWCLIRLCHRSFTYADKLILMNDKSWIDTDKRCEYFMLYVLEQNELEGNAYMNARDMAKELDKYVVKQSKKVAIKSDSIHYDELTNEIAKNSTYIAENNISNFVVDKIQHSIQLDWDWKKFKENKNGTLTDEQTNVLEEFCKYNIIIVDGFAGSGKTSVMLNLLQMCDEYEYSYKLFAPTGRASKRLSEATNRPAYTIHRGTQLGTADLWEDVIIVDESSMLNLETMSMLLRCIRNDNVRVIFLGDIIQLPPIGLGCIFRELINSEKVPICTLTKVFRFSSSDMMKVTTLARQGETYLNQIDNAEDDDYKFIPFNESTAQIIDTYMDYIKAGIPMDEIVVLTPRNVGEYGTYNINNLIQKAVNPIMDNEKCFKHIIDRKEIRFHINDLVLVTKNNYNMLNWKSYDELDFDDELSKDDVPKTAIFNGEIGKVIGFEKNAMKVSIDDEIIMFYNDDVQNLLLGYCTTIYKFQGSQINYPIVLTITEHKNQLNKNLLYTNLSRGQKKLIEIADKGAIEYALNTKVLNDKQNKICTMIQEGINDGQTT